MATNRPGQRSTNLRLSDCRCPICLCILIDPVTMPCEHELCINCFRENVQQTSLRCPMCRLRISSWARKAARENKLVDLKRWKEIREAFPEEVERRLQGVEEEVEEEETDVVVQHLSKPGEIREEYEKEIERLREQRELEKRREEEESAKVLRELQEKAKEAEKQRLADLLLAKELSERFQNNEATPDVTVLHQRFIKKVGLPQPCDTPKTGRIDNFFTARRPSSETSDNFPCISPSDKQDNTTEELLTPSSTLRFPKSTPSCTVVKQESVDTSFGSVSSSPSRQSSSPEILTKFHKLKSGQCPIKPETVSPDVICVENVKEEKVTPPCGNVVKRSSSTHSEDSITQELVHFRPIKSCPKTPPRPTGNGRFVDVPVVVCTPLNPSQHQTHSSHAPQDTSIVEPNAKIGSPVVARSLAQLSNKRKELVKACSKSTSTGLLKYKIINASSMKALTFDRGDLKNLSDSSDSDDVNMKSKHVESCASSSFILPLESNIEDENSDFDPFRDSSDDERTFSSDLNKIPKRVEKSVTSDESVLVRRTVSSRRTPSESTSSLCQKLDDLKANVKSKNECDSRKSPLIHPKQRLKLKRKKQFEKPNGQESIVKYFDKTKNSALSTLLDGDKSGDILKNTGKTTCKASVSNNLRSKQIIQKISQKTRDTSDSDETTDESPVKKPKQVQTRKTHKNRQRQTKLNSYLETSTTDTSVNEPASHFPLRSKRNDRPTRSKPTHKHDVKFMPIRKTHSKSGSVDSDFDSDATTEEISPKIRKHKKSENLKEKTDSESEGDGLSMEEKDRLLAHELQLQFEYEAKNRHVNMLKTRGSIDDYNFRSRKRNGSARSLLGK